MERLHVLTLISYCKKNNLTFTEGPDFLLIDAGYSQAKKLVNFAVKNNIPVEWSKVHAFVRFE